MSGDRHSGCRTSAVIGGSSGGRSSSAGKVGSAGKHGKGIKKPGWEDAGVEFYREAYPGAVENVYDSNLRTLLPSKKYSVGTMGRGDTRRRSSTRNARKRQQQYTAANTLIHTTRRGSDTYLEVFPDLTQGADEEETWNKLQQIRMHAVPMREKRELKKQLLDAPTLRTRGLAAVKLSRRKFISRVKFQIKEFISKIGLWRSSLKYIEGNFGTGLVAFFTFIKWLLFLNLFSSLLIVFFIILPQVILTESEDWCDVDSNRTSSLLLFTLNAARSFRSLFPTLKLTYEHYSTALPDKPTVPPDIFSTLSYTTNSIEESTTFLETTASTTKGTTTTSTTTVPTTTFSPSVVSDAENIYTTSANVLMDILFSNDTLPRNPNDTLASNLPTFEALVSNVGNGTECCYEKYKELVQEKDGEHHYLIQLLLDCLQGTGVLELSPLFYGFYPRAKITIEEFQGFVYSKFNLPLSYLLVMLFIFIFNLVLMVRKAAKGLRDSLRSSEGQFYQLSNMVFGGWDYCIENNKAATVKKKAIYNELKNFIETEHYREEKEMRTRKEKCCLYLIRLLINILVVLTLIASFVAIYYATSFSFENLTKIGDKLWVKEHFESEIEVSYEIIDENGTNSPGTEEAWSEVPWWRTLMFEYLPSGTILALNLIVPYIFKFLVQFEKYTPNFILTLTLIRTVFLRLASLVVLLFTVYQKIRSCEKMEDTMEQCFRTTKECNKQIVCWETSVGQQLYKLTLLDLIVMFIVTFFINFPRKILGHVLMRNSRCGEVIGNIEFEIPKHVLDVVYSQTLCWLGMFFSPLLPAISCIKLILTFYIKYFDCSFNSTQSSQLYRTSRSNSLFISILLISFIVTIIPVGFSIVELKPSTSCGPFFNLPTIWTEVIRLIEDSPHWLQSLLFFAGTAGFAVPAVIVLILAGYYYYAVAAANKHMVSLLKHQLVLEGHDKQFLLMRLDRLIKRTQELEELQRSERSSDFATELMSGANDLTLDLRSTD